jgi:N-acetylglucosaminyldiphosphoundecaprenol N-acetyl-beta-D-mannosaminyltransferase
MTPPPAHPVVACAGVPVAAIGPEDAAAQLVWLARAPRPSGLDVHLCNAYTLALADADPALHDVLACSPLNLPDGTPVVWANRLLHPDVEVPRQRVRGPGLFTDVFALGEAVGLRHYLLGSTPQVLAALQEELGRRYPDALIVGASSPPFRDLTDQERAEQDAAIRDSGAEVVWVGLGTPKQDLVAAELAGRLPQVFVAVGAAFDFVAGSKPEAAVWMQRSGLEWAHRLVHEPRRLWRRYLFGTPRFVRAALTGSSRAPAALPAGGAEGDRLRPSGSLPMPV